MKSILPTAIIFAGSLLFASADVVAKSHEEVGKQSATVMTEMVNGMAKIKDKASADAFVATVPDIKAKMKAILEAAKALPAPTEAEKTAVNKMMDDEKMKSQPLMMTAMTAIAESPEADAIGVALATAMNDPEMGEIGEALEAIYSQEEKDAPAPAIE